MAIVHIVLFEWKPSISHAQVEEVGTSSEFTLSVLIRCMQACGRMLALQHKCLGEDTQKPYIKSFSGGRNNSNEGHAVCNFPTVLGILS